MECVDVVKKKELKEGSVNKVSFIKTEQLGTDAYYFKAGQVLAYHRHPEGDQIFFVHEGKGKFYLDNGKEESVPLTPGVCVLAPKGVWHKIVADGELVVSQVTRQPAGMETR